MIEVRTEKKENPYVMIDNRPLNDRELSYGARGLLSYLLSKPDDWTIQMHDLVNGPDGAHRVRRYLKELQEEGYAYLKRSRDKKGRISGSEWIIREQPIKKHSTEIAKNRKPEKPRSDNQHLEKPETGKVAYIISTELVQRTEYLQKKERESAPEKNIFQFFLDQYKAKQTSNLSIAFCKTNPSDQEKILKHLPLYISNTSKRGEQSDKPWRKSALNYLKSREWENEIEHTDPTVLPSPKKESKVLPAPTGRMKYVGS